MISQSEITYDVYISDMIPQADATPLPNGDHPMWSPMSSTLISGPTEAVLIDPPLTIKQTEALAAWVESFGKKLSIPDASILAKTVPADGFSVDGAKIVVVEVGHSDGDNSTMLHVPSIGLVVAGDVVYTNVHQYLVESSGGGLDAWLHALDIVEALNPTRVVAGHKDKTRDDDPSNIAATRNYLNDAKGLLATRPTQLQFFSQMMKLYPERINPTVLWISAQALLRDE